MENTYNFYNLEASFRDFLLAGNNMPISIKNYLSDFRHFIGWFTLYSKSSNSNTEHWDNEDISTILTPELIKNYKDYLRENNIPVKTINRRLSTIRKFCSFCISQGWLKENPGKKINNVSATPSIEENLMNFKKNALGKTNIDESTRILNDLNEFFTIINS